MFQIILTLGVHQTKITAPLEKMQEGLNTEQGGELGRGRHNSGFSRHITWDSPSNIQWEKLPLNWRWSCASIFYVCTQLLFLMTHD